MYSGIAAALLFVVFAIFFLIYKRHMITRLFSFDIASQVELFQKDIQNTAGLAVNKINTSSEELAELLQQAEETIEELKIRTKIAEEQLYKCAASEIHANSQTQLQPLEIMTPARTFAQQLLEATYNTTRHLDLPKEEPRPTFAEVYEQNEEVLLTEIKPALKNQPVSPPMLDMSNAEPKFKYKQIMKLAADGCNDIEIAKTLGLGVGEVSLTRKFGVK